MKPSESIKPISYLKAHLSEVINEIVASRNPVIVTQNGEPKVVVQDLQTYESIQDSLAMLKILALSAKDLEAGRYKPVKQAFSDVRKWLRGQEGS